MTQTTTTKKTTRQRSTVKREKIQELLNKRRRSSFPTSARTERLYWQKQLAAIIGE